MLGSADRRVVLVLLVGVGLVLAGAFTYLAMPAVGTLTIQVRDAPTNFSHVVVSFSEVRVHRADAGNDSGWVYLTLAASTIDLMSLGNLTKVLALDKVPAGKYTQIRIVVDAANGTIMGGASIVLVVPDRILKTDTPFDLAAGGATTVTLDFDLAHSIHQSGSTWIFSPVLGSVVVS